MIHAAQHACLPAGRQLDSNAMSTVQEIKTAIESLTPEERAELERLLHSPAVNSVPVRLPNYA